MWWNQSQKVANIHPELTQWKRRPHQLHHNLMPEAYSISQIEWESSSESSNFLFSDIYLSSRAGKTLQVFRTVPVPGGENCLFQTPKLSIYSGSYSHCNAFLHSSSKILLIYSFNNLHDPRAELGYTWAHILKLNKPPRQRILGQIKLSKYAWQSVVTSYQVLAQLLWLIILSLWLLNQWLCFWPVFLATFAWDDKLSHFICQWLNGMFERLPF